MTISDLLNKTCLIGLTYMTAEGEVLKLSQLAGEVIAVDEEEGISVELFTPDSNTTPTEPNKIASTADSSNAEDKPAVFHLPPGLSAWFIAPKGHFKNPEFGIDIENPDYFVTWDIVRKKDSTPEGTHEWWEWHPRTTPPSVN